MNNTQPLEKLEFGYWPIKLKGHGIRMLLEYLGLEYVEWNPKNSLDWKIQRDDLKHLSPIIRIPYLRDGDFVISGIDSIETALCLRAGRDDLLGQTDEDEIEIRMLQCILNSMRKNTWDLFSAKTSLRDAFEGKGKVVIEAEITKLSQFLGDKEFMANYLSLIDFGVVHLIDLYSWICSELGTISPFEKYNNLIQLSFRIKMLPELRDYLRSKDCESLPWIA